MTTKIRFSPLRPTINPPGPGRKQNGRFQDGNGQCNRIGFNQISSGAGPFLSAIIPQQRYPTQPAQTIVFTLCTAGYYPPDICYFFAVFNISLSSYSSAAYTAPFHTAPPSAAPAAAQPAPELPPPAPDHCPSQIRSLPFR